MMKFFIVLLLTVAANGFPKLTSRLMKQEIQAEKISSLMMPGPVLPGKTSVEVEPVHASPNCILCEFVMEKLDQMLSQNATEEEIKEALEKVCSLLPSSVSTECTEFIDKYADLVLKYLSQGLNPQMVCTELGLCKSSNLIREISSNPIAVEINDIGSATSCELCEKVAKELDNLITQNSTQQEIEQGLEQFCALLPGDLKSECDQFVEQYLPEILNLLALEVSPDMLCQALGLCPSLLKEVQVEATAPKDANLTCDLCKQLMGIAKELASKNDTVQDVERLLGLICYYMLPVIKECQDFIKNVIPKIFDELSKMDPEAICENPSQQQCIARRKQRSPPFSLPGKKYVNVTNESKQIKLCPSSAGMNNDVRCFMSDISRCFKP